MTPTYKLINISHVFFFPEVLQEGDVRDSEFSRDKIGGGGRVFLLGTHNLLYVREWGHLVS